MSDARGRSWRGMAARLRELNASRQQHLGWAWLAGWHDPFAFASVLGGGCSVAEGLGCAGGGGPMTVTLSTLGSRGVTFEVRPSPLYETGAGGVALQVEIPWLPDEHPWRRVSYAFSASEALELCEELRAVLPARLGETR